MSDKVLTFDVSEVSESIWTLLNETLPQNVNSALTKVCLKIEQDSKENCPSNDGTLRASITHDVEGKDGVYEGFVGSNLEYAPYVHQGTGIYAIDGNGRKDVPWVYRDKDGNFHTTSGQHSTPFIQDAVDTNRDSILNYFKGVFNRDNRSDKPIKE